MQKKYSPEVMKKSLPGLSMKMSSKVVKKEKKNHQGWWKKVTAGSDIEQKIYIYICIYIYI